MGTDFMPKRLQTPIDKLARNQAGKRSFTITERKRGRYVQARPANGKTNDLAFDATFRAAAPFQIHRDHTDTALALEKGDLQRKILVFAGLPI